jgi:hypothetical protein
MAKQLLSAICLIVLLCLSAFAQREKSTLLPASEAKNVTHQCSRPSPEKFSDTWRPSKAEIKEMEANFSQIKRLRVEECCIQGAQVENPEEFYMQYIGIIVNGDKLIYINAFAGHSEGWKEVAVTICDGGNAWGVLYNPNTKKFYGLAMNGV